MSHRVETSYVTAAASRNEENEFMLFKLELNLIDADAIVPGRERL